MLTTGILFRRFPVILFAFVLLVFLVLILRFQRRPEITSMDRLVASPGDTIELTGRYFGKDADSGKLYIGSRHIGLTGIIEWGDSRIVARVPLGDGSSLVWLKTRAGRSKGVVLADAARFPEVDFGPWFPDSPYIEYADPPEVSPGTLVTLVGSGFGDRRGNGKIYVNRGDDSLLATEKPDLTQYIKVRVIEEWMGDSVKFRVPSGFSKGNVYLFKDGNFSNPVVLERNSLSADRVEGPIIQWSLYQSVSVSRVGSLPGNALYVNLPNPSPGAGQGAPTVIEAIGPGRVSPLRIMEQATVYMLDELASGRQYSLSRSLVVNTHEVRFTPIASQTLSYDRTNPELVAALGRDAWIDPASVAGYARAQAGGGSDWIRARRLYDYIGRVIDWTADSTEVVPAQILQSRGAASQGYSFLFCALARAAGIPARPVGGILVMDDSSTRPWWWAEFWMEGSGWIPLDPALADSDLKLPGVPDGAALLRDYYFGGLDARHIAFSRGILDSVPLRPESRFHRPEHPYSLQNVWEEVSGNLESYLCRWDPPRVVGVYEKL